MFLTPSDTEKLLLSVAGMVARDRLERGVHLNHPEAIALLSCWVLERAREGATVEQLMEEGVQVLRADQVMAGVPEMIDHVQVEATFPDGRKLVTLSHPIRAVAGSDPGDQEAETVVPGAIRVRDGSVELNAGREKRVVVVFNEGDRPVQIGSHIHLADVNPAVSFLVPNDEGGQDPVSVEGFRLDIPAGTSIRFQPGDAKRLGIVALGGTGAVPGIRPGKPGQSAGNDEAEDQGE
ncbi:urease subunit gamma [Marinactinospora thermotolerans]|uniref:urease n=1 Tax=Marinactinospora thermotolerans DSM 45154 TaxID=1122192 RepID=A0A1T4LI28_9ACTN|nr:urease subunit gamma [Marinactinospora thermotolerans]SJZ54268.1 urease subunit gamma/beta [Marinactinospora thermotolerans DSM 45154]